MTRHLEPERTRARACRHSPLPSWRRWRSVGPILLTAMIGACDDPGSATDRSGVGAASVALEPVSERGAVMPTRVGRTLLSQCTRSGPWGVTGFWTPSPETISQLESRLPTVVDSVLRRVPDIGPAYPSAKEYYRQYIGIQRWTGKKSIYVNAFHESHLRAVNRVYGRSDRNRDGQPDTVPWHNRPVDVCDGGVLFFGVEYEPEDFRFGRVYFNDRASGAVRY